MSLNRSFKLEGISIPKYVILFWAQENGKFFSQSVTETGEIVILIAFDLEWFIFRVWVYAVLIKKRSMSSADAAIVRLVLDFNYLDIWIRA